MQSMHSNSVSISGLIPFYLRNRCVAPMVVSPENHPIPTFVPLSGIVPDL